METKRQTNIEVLRVFSMFLIVVMHYIFCGLKQNPALEYYDMETLLGGANYLTMEPLYILSQTAVNCYVMITGYFLINKLEYRWDGILRVIVQTLFYSLLFFLGIVVLHGEFDKSQMLKSFFPVHQWGYWFVTVYIGLLLIAPLLSRIAVSLTKKQYQIILAILFVLNFQYLYGGVYAGHRTVLFFGFLYLIAGYLRIHGIPSIINKHKHLLFWGTWLILVLLATAFNIRKGQFELIGTAYDGPVLFLSIAIFILFITGKFKGSFFSFIAKVSPYTFGVYLIHTNCFVNDWLWKLLPNYFTYPIIIDCIIFCFLVFTSCVLIDNLRSRVFKLFSINKVIDKISHKIPQL